MQIITVFFSTLFCTNDSFEWMESFKPKICKELSRAKINDSIFFSKCSNGSDIEGLYKEFCMQLKELISNDNEWIENEYPANGSKEFIHRLNCYTNASVTNNPNERVPVLESMDGNPCTNIGVVGLNNINYPSISVPALDLRYIWDMKSAEILGIIGVTRKDKKFIPIAEIEGKELKTFQDTLIIELTDEYEEVYLILKKK